VLVYQHFPREARIAYIERLAQRLQDETTASEVFSFSTPHVLFLLAAQERHVASFRDVARNLPLCWPEREIQAREVRPRLPAQ
jgi:phospholipid N-methyltransferase